MGRKCLEAHLVMGPKARQKEEEEVTRPRGACRDAVVGRGRRGEGRKGGRERSQGRPCGTMDSSLDVSSGTAYLQCLATLGMEIMRRF